MKAEILYSPAYSMAKVALAPTEEIRVEAGAMVGFSSGVEIATRVEGGLFKALGRALLTNESFFINTLKAPAHGGEVLLAPPLPGDMFTLDLENETLLVQSGSYVASAVGVEIDTTWGGAKTFFASEGLILLRAQGTGTLILSSYGAIHSMELKEGETFTVDTGHLVAFSDKMGFNVRSVGGLKSTFLSGEGLVVDLTGPGQVLMQTRSDDAFITWIMSMLPKPQSDGG